MVGRHRCIFSRRCGDALESVVVVVALSIFWAPFLLLVSGSDLRSTALYGGVFKSPSTIAYAEVVQTCFGGLKIGSCQSSSPNWLKDHLYQYNEAVDGAYCASCCSNTDISGDTWEFDCLLTSSAFVNFVNLFGWEFRFGRRETADDREVVTCPIPRRACSYASNGEISGSCEADRSFLEGYILTVEVMRVDKGLRSWSSVQGCSVESIESTEQPDSFSETIVMTQVYGRGSGIEVGWALFITLVALSFVSCGVRWARHEHCMVCGNRLIYLYQVCLPCRLYGYEPPSKDVMKIIKEKRSVVLPDPTPAACLESFKATTAKVFVQATETLRSTGLSSHCPPMAKQRSGLHLDGARSPVSVAPLGDRSGNATKVSIIHDKIMDKERWSMVSGWGGKQENGGSGERYIGQINESTGLEVAAVRDSTGETPDQTTGVAEGRPSEASSTAGVVDPGSEGSRRTSLARSF